MKVPEHTRLQVDALLSVMFTLEVQLDAVDAELRRFARADERCQALQSIDGVGPILACHLLAEIDEARRFRRAEQVTRLAGLDPVVDESGETRHRGKLAKAGSAHLRWALVEAAVHAHRTTAVAVNREGVRCSLGLDVVTSEDGAAWLAFLRGLVARGLSGVQLVTSDANVGLVEAIQATLPGAAWQRCRTYCMRNLLTRVPKAAQSFVATIVRTIFAQRHAETVLEQHRRVFEGLGGRFPEAAALLAEVAPDLARLHELP